MRFRYLWLFLAVVLVGGLALENRLAHGHPRPTVPPAPSAAPLQPDLAPGERDPGADLEGQMMLDPVTRTYLGG